MFHSESHLAKYQKSRKVSVLQSMQAKLENAKITGLDEFSVADLDQLLTAIMHVTEMRQVASNLHFLVYRQLNRLSP